MIDPLNAHAFIPLVVLFSCCRINMAGLSLPGGLGLDVVALNTSGPSGSSKRLRRKYEAGLLPASFILYTSKPKKEPLMWAMCDIELIYEVIQRDSEDVAVGKQLQEIGVPDYFLLMKMKLGKLRPLPKPESLLRSSSGGFRGHPVLNIPPIHEARGVELASCRMFHL